MVIVENVVGESETTTLESVRRGLMSFLVKHIHLDLVRKRLVPKLN